VSTPAASELTDSQGRMLVFLSFSAFASATNLRICDSLLPQIATEFSVTVGNAAAVVTAFAISYGLAQIGAGPLADARGKLFMIAAGSLMAGGMTALCAAMPQLVSLVAFRFLAGAGAAAVIPLAMAWIGDVVPYDKRQPILARFLSGQIMGIVCGQAMGGILGDFAGWRVTMLTVAVLHLVAGCMLILEMRRSGLGAVTPGRARWRQSAISTARVFQTPWVRVILATVFLEGFAMFGAFAFVGSELHTRFGISLSAAGVMLATLGVGAMIYAMTAPILVARLRQPGLVRYGSLGLAGGYLTLAVMPSAWFAVPAIMVMGLGFYMFHNTLQTNATQMAPEARGLAMSLFAFTLFVSQSVGVAVAAPIMDRWGGRPIFVVSALLLLVAAQGFRSRLLVRLA
jgi:predicted MFS family arabinose efflux permease